MEKQYRIGIVDIDEEDLKKWMSILVDKNIISKEQENDYELLIDTIYLCYGYFLRKKIEVEEVVLSNSFQQFLINMLNNKINYEQPVNWENGHWEKIEVSSLSDDEFESLCLMIYNFFEEDIYINSVERVKEIFSHGDFHLFYEGEEENKIILAILYNERKYFLNSFAMKGIKDSRDVKLFQDIILEKFKSLNLVCDSIRLDTTINDSLIESIYNKYLNGEELTKDDLKILYKIDKTFENYIMHIEMKSSNLSNRKIYRILKSRNMKSDLAKIFDCDISQIFHDRDGNETEYNIEELPKDIVVYYGETALKRNIDIGTVKVNSIEGQETCTKCPKYFYGLLDCSSYTSGENLKLPEHFVGKLNLKGLKSAKGLNLPAHFNGELDLSGLESTKDLILPSNFDGELNLSGVKNIDDFVIPEDFTGTIDLSGVERLENYKFPENFKGTIFLGGLRIAKNVDFPKKLEGTLIIGNLEELENVNFPKYIGRNFSISIWNLKEMPNVNFPEHIERNFTLEVFESLENFAMPKFVGGYFSLKEINYLKNVSLPKYLLGGTDSLSYLCEAINVTFPSHSNGTISLNSLPNLNGIIFPEKGDYKIYYQDREYTLDEIKEKQRMEIKCSLFENGKSRGVISNTLLVSCIVLFVIIVFAVSLLLVK